MQGKMFSRVGAIFLSLVATTTASVVSATPASACSSETIAFDSGQFPRWENYDTNFTAAPAC